jgi:hypothetical protein
VTPVPLADLGLNSRHRVSALWWLALLYRRPAAFTQAIDGIEGLPAQLKAAAILYLNSLPFVLGVATVGRVIIFDVLELPMQNPATDLGLWTLVEWHGRGLASGLAVGLAVGSPAGSAVGSPSGSLSGLRSRLQLLSLSRLLVGSRAGSAAG